MRAKLDPPRGILNVRPPTPGWGHARYWPSKDLAPFVEHYWIVRWDVAAPEVAETLPHPSVHMVLGQGGAEVVGVMRGRFTTTLSGRGHVLGTKFRPGAFRAFVERPVAVFSNRRWPAVEVLGRRAEGLAARAFACQDDREEIAVVEAFLRSFRPAADAAMELAGSLVAHVAANRELTRVDQLAGERGVPVRGLQRLFRDYVGVSPKWVIQRYRLIEAAERLAADEGADGTQLALDLGYADQAQFIRDFKRLVGLSPAAYARRLGETLR